MDFASSANCDDSIRQELFFLFLAACALTLYIIFRLVRPSKGAAPRHVGLQLCYLANFWINHWVVVPLYLMPWYCGENATYTALGVRESLYGLVGFVVGSTLVSYIVKGHNKKNEETREISSRVRNRFFVLGFFFYVLSSVLSGVSGVTAVLYGGQFLVIVGFIMSIYSAYRRGDYRSAMQWVVASVMFPFTSIIRGGFLGFGIVALLPVVIFTLTWLPRIRLGWLAVLALVGGYLGLSLFVTYMRDRAEIRRSVWGKESYADRLARMANTFSNFEWFSPFDEAHLSAIDGRLNQNYLVGASVVYTESTQVWAAGETLRDAALGFIPRLIWPDKPVAGSGDLVSKYTGIEFAEGTSVGIGQVMEFYVNFGSPMVFLGFCLFGSILAWLDLVAASALVRGAPYEFLVPFLAGLSMQQVGGSLVEVVAGCAGSLVVGYMVKMMTGENARRRRVARQAMVAG